jgi:malate synthase
VNDFDGATLRINDNNTPLWMTDRATLRISDNNTALWMTLMELCIENQW